MPVKKKIVLQYKYPEQPWQDYDWTQVLAWAETQEKRMIQEHPGATYRRTTK